MSLILPGVSYETHIVVQTRKGTNIPNAQLHEISAYERNSYTLFDKDYPLVIKRMHGSPVYNCHGMTFASRRTCVFRDEDVQVILRDDGYAEVSLEHVKPGDVVLYFEDGSIEHSGIVVDVPRTRPLMPTVCSKWAKYSEVIHSANDCPYKLMQRKYYRVME